MDASRKDRRQRWWKSQLEKKKADKLDDRAKALPNKRFTNKQSNNKTPSLSSHGFRSVTVSSQPVASKAATVRARSGVNNNDMMDSHKRSESDPIRSTDMDGTSSSEDDYDEMELVPEITHSKNSTPITSKSKSSITQLDSKEKTEPSCTKQKISDTTSEKKSSCCNKRYILFLGNLSESSTHQDIVAHFKKRGVAVKEVRLLTHKDTKKSRGCAFAEFENEKCFQNALKFHRSKLNGKTINIEVTCGGGGKGDNRKTKILNKNRRQRIAKAKKTKV